MGISVAFCTNLRVVGGLYAVLFGGMYLIEYLQDGWRDYRRLGTGLAAAGSAVLAFVLITPATWPSLLDYLIYTISNASGFSRWITGALCGRSLSVYGTSFAMALYYVDDCNHDSGDICGDDSDRPD